MDASLQAYGTAVYLQCVNSDGTTSSLLIASKSKVAPLKPMTVPRLEQMGVVLGLGLTQHLIIVLGLPMQVVTFYSDSMDAVGSWTWAKLSSFLSKWHWGESDGDRTITVAARSRNREPS